MTDREPRRGDRVEWMLIAALVVLTIAGAAASIVQMIEVVRQ